MASLTGLAANPNPNKSFEILPNPGDSVSSLSFSPKSNLLVATSWDNQVRCWEIVGGNSQPKASISHDQPVLCSAWKDDGTTVFSGGCDKQVKMWPLLSGGQPQTVAMHDAPVKEVAWIPQMNLLVSGSWDKTLSRLQPLATSGAPGRYVTSGPVGGGTAMGIYELQRHLVAAGVWGEPFRPDADAVALPLPAVVPTVTLAPPALDVVVEAEEVKFGKRLLQAQQDDVAPAVEEEAPPPSSDSFGYDDDDARPRDKIQRRLAQNREAARKSRLRKKAYIQNLETSRMKLAQLEQELTMARRQQHGAYGVGGGGVAAPAAVDPRVAAFELEYAHWVEEQDRQATELRAALQSHAPDVQLRVLVDAGLAHYGALFQAKARVARSDAFFVLSGVWRAPAERFFLWIGGFRPSELLKVLAPQLDPLMELQAAEVRKLQNTARQLEDALTQGMNKLQQTLVETLMTVDVSPDGAAAGWYAAQQMASAVGKLADLVDFVDKADHLRQQTLRNMHKILTPRQAARGLLALADYGQRLRALSSLWAARRREPA